MIDVTADNYLADGDKGWVKFGPYYLHETFRQEYGGNNCIFAAGKLHDTETPVDTVYLWIQKDGVDPTILFLRPDEALSICSALTRALWFIDRNGPDFVPENEE